ncbi:MAG: heparinase II/III family protein, partial [Hyphomicrobiales bacterium]
AGFEELFYRSLGRHVRYLSRHIPFAPQDFSRLEASIALCHASLCLDLGKNLQDQALAALSRELESQILPDGGHVSREPMKLVELLGELLPLVSMLENSNQAAPEALVNAVDRMTPMLRLLSHGDGGLAAFNGVGKTLRTLIDEIETCSNSNGKPVAHAKYSGYARLEGGASAVIIDCGFPPNPRFATNAHAGLLSFEFSEGSERIVVNCGAPGTPDKRWSKLARTTTAHSTAILDHEPSSHIADASLIHTLAGGPLHIGPRAIECELENTGSGMVLEGRHDGYAKAYGIVHERRLWLNEEGSDFRGEDRFEGEREADAKAIDTGFAIRFHLHPSVKATLSRDGSTVMLLLANRSGWRFTAKGARLAVDESVYLVDSGEPQRTSQIVLSGFAARGHAVNWAFKKIAKKRRKSGEASQEPELPLG